MNCYEILGIPTTASIDDIVSAHRRLVKKYHPDRLRDASMDEIRRSQEKFTEVQEAYETLTRNRAEYDAQLRAEAAANTPPSASHEEQESASVPTPPQAGPFPPNSTVGRRLNPWQLLGRIVFSSGGMVLLAFLAIYSIETIGTANDPAFRRGLFFAPYPMLARYSAYRGEQFEGTIRNPGTNASAELKISLIESGGSLSGCMAMGQPFSGSGPLSGSYSGADFNFSVKTAAGRYRIRGKRRDGDIGGTYSLEPAHQAKEGGTFTLGKVEDVDDAESLSYDACPTDAEFHQR